MGILDLMNGIEAAGDRGKARGQQTRLGQLYAGAMQAPREQRGGYLAEMAKVSPDAATGASGHFDKLDDSGRKQLGQYAAAFAALPADQKAAAYPQFADMGRAAGLPVPQGEYRPEFDAGIQQIGQAFGGGGDEMKSLTKGQNGNYWAIRNGQFVDTGVQYDPTRQLRDQPGITPGLLTTSGPNAGAIQGIGTQQAAPQQPQAPAGGLPINVNYNGPEDGRAAFMAAVNADQSIGAPQGDYSVNMGGPQAQQSGPAAMRPAITPLQAAADQRAEEASRRASEAADNAKRGNAPAGYRFKADGSLEPIPGAPKTAEAAGGAESQKQAAYAKNMAQDALAFAAAFTGLPQAQLAKMTPEQVRTAMMAHDRSSAGPVVGSLPFMDKFANADLAAYSNAAAGKQARINNPTGPVTNADFEVANKSVFSANKPQKVNADLVYQALTRAQQASQAPAPKVNEADVRRRALLDKY